MKTVIVGSKNPVKLKAVELAFGQVFPNETFELEGVNVPSGVAEQPFGEEETIKGAKNRVANARRARPDADFWVGMESGLMDAEGNLEVFSRFLVVSKTDAQSWARTATYIIPPAAATLVRNGMSLGKAYDQTFGTQDIGRKAGSVAIVTDNLIDRTALYTHAMILALGPINHSELYQSDFIEQQRRA